MNLQQLVGLYTTGAFSNTPSVAVEVLLDLKPLDVTIQGEAWKTAYRLQQQDIPYSGVAIPLQVTPTSIAHLK